VATPLSLGDLLDRAMERLGRVVGYYSPDEILGVLDVKSFLLDHGEHYTEHLVQLKPGDRVFLFTDGVGEVVGSENSTGLTAPDLAARLEQFAFEPLADQIRNVLDLSNNAVVDDVLLVGCEIAAT
jgi:hypothetical protein